jgi:hypothetical protein
MSFFATKLQPKIDNQVATNRSFFACNQHQSRYFLLQKLEQYVFLVLFFLQPHTTMIFFALQISPHSRLLPFFAMHMGIMLQPEGTLRCKLARQFVPAAIYQTMKFFFAIAHEISVATRTHVCKLLQPPKLFNNLQKH